MGFTSFRKNSIITCEKKSNTLCKPPNDIKNYVG